MGAKHAVVRVIDAETLVLDDQTEVRLINALAPRSPDGLVPDDDWPPARNATAFLAGLVQGAVVQLAQTGRRIDRYGRSLAQVFVVRDDVRIWVQGELIRNGHARAYGLPQSFDCVSELLAFEADARLAGRGLWESPFYALQSAEDRLALSRAYTTFQIVEGTVRQVSRTRNHVYLNFGSDWQRDFTAGVIISRTEKAWVTTLAGLEGQRVRVRGWIERQHGPSIAVTDASQIEQVSPLPAGSHRQIAKDRTPKSKAMPTPE